MNEPIRFQYRVLGEGNKTNAPENTQKTESETATDSARNIEKIIREENPNQYSEFYYLRSGKFESQLPTELEKNSQVKEAYQKLKDLYQELNDKLRSFPGNQEETEALIKEIDQYLLSELPKLTSRITNRSLTELKNFATEQKNELIESKISEVLAQRRTLLNEISEDDFDDRDPRKLNVTFPGSLKEKGQARLDLLKESGAWIKKLIETDLPELEQVQPEISNTPATESEPESQPEPELAPATEPAVENKPEPEPEPIPESAPATEPIPESAPTTESWASRINENLARITQGNDIYAIIDRLKNLENFANKKLLEVPDSEKPEIISLIKKLQEMSRRYEEQFNAQELATEIQNIKNAYAYVEQTVNSSTNELSRAYLLGRETFNEIGRLYNPEARFKLSVEQIQENLRIFFETLDKSIKGLEAALQEQDRFDKEFNNRKQEVQSSIQKYDKKNILTSLQDIEKQLKTVIDEMYAIPNFPIQNRNRYQELIQTRIDFVREILQRNS